MLGFALPQEAAAPRGTPSVRCRGGAAPGQDWVEVRRQKGRCESEGGRVRGKVCDFLTSERHPFSPKPPFSIQDGRSLRGPASVLGPLYL